MLQSSIRAQQNRNAAANSNFTRQGSQRRVVATDMHKQDILAKKNEEIAKLNKKFYQEYIITAEYQMLQSENIKGIYVIPSKESSFLWFGVIFVRTGLYEDAIFRFNIYLSETFPEGEQPKVVFQSEVYHPVINQSTNELNLLKAFPVWKSGEHHIYNILRYVQKVFYDIPSVLEDSVDSSIREEFEKNMESFKEKVQLCVKKSTDEIYDPPPFEDLHYLTFEPYNPEVHDPVRKFMSEDRSHEDPKRSNDGGSRRGHSWVAPDSFKPLSRPPTPDEDETDS